MRYNRTIAQIRARGEHAFWMLKCQFGYQRTRYRGLVKNSVQLTTLFALANLCLMRRHLLTDRGATRPDPRIFRKNGGNPTDKRPHDGVLSKISGWGSEI